LKLVLPAFILLGMFSATFTSCKKTTTNNIVSKDSIYYSPWVQLSLTMVGVDSQGDTVYDQQLTAPSITAKSISQGAVLGFFGGVTQSGDTAMFNEAELGNNVEVTFAPGSVEIDSYKIDISYDNGGYLFKYVIIPGNILAASSLKGMTQQQLNKMSFTDLQKAINTSKQATGNTFNP
jgi:hypothetical protein